MLSPCANRHSSRLPRLQSIVLSHVSCEAWTVFVRSEPATDCVPALIVNTNAQNIVPALLICIAFRSSMGRRLLDSLATEMPWTLEAFRKSTYCVLCSDPVIVTVTVPLVAAALEPTSVSDEKRILMSYARPNVNTAPPYMAFCKAP
jgi:hypothetical protein